MIRIDGDICVVSFDKENQQQLEITSDKVRIVHKDDLCLAAKHNAQIDVVARTPRKVNTPTGARILTADIDEEGIVHTILAYPAKDNGQGKIQYGKYDLNKADASPHLVTLPTTVASFNGHSYTPQIDHTFGDCPVILLDALRVHHPLFFNTAGLLQDPEWFWLGLPPITALSSSIYNMPQFIDPKRDKAFVALVVFKRQILMPLILANYGHLVKVILDVLTEKYAEFESLIETIYAEIVDGQRNILHAAIDGQLKSAKKEDKKLDIDPCLLGLGEPSPKQRQSNSQQEIALANVIDAIQTLFDSNMAQTLQHLILAKSTPTSNQERTSVIKKTDALTQSTGTNEQNTTASADGDIFWGSAELSRLQQKYPFEPDEQQSPVHEHLFAAAPKPEPVLTVLLSASLIEVQLNNLLEQRDAFGRTPFMYAIHRRSYAEGNALFTKALELAAQTEEEEAALQKYIYPVGSPPDLNPLYVLCCNDTCSFTWTKDKHINQDIYECKTCGLTESLCCCSECARTCHAGHDCVLKKTSPTAYCDCLEKCPCAAQEEGDQESRASLLEALLTHSSLVEQTTSRGEHLLQFLAQTVARQVKEQAQKLDIDAKGAGPRPKMGGGPSDDQKDAPPIAPPTFCRSALTRVLRDWRAVSSLVMNDRDPLCASSSKNVSADDQTLLKGQNGSARLDKFTHTLLLKLTASEYLSSLIGTIQSHEDASPHVAERFIRSVIRIFVCFASGMAPQTTEKQLSTLNKAKQIFLALPAHATKSLCLAAESLVKPMRLGAVRPVESFTPGAEADEVIKTTEELFSTGPMVPRRDRKVSNRNRQSRRSETNNHPVPPPRTNSTRRWRDELQQLTGMNRQPGRAPVRQYGQQQQQDDIQTDVSDDEEMDDVQENVEDEEEMFVEQNLINGEEEDDVEMDSQDNQDENQPVDIDGEETDEVEEEENEDNEIMDEFGADEDNNEGGVGLLPDEVELDEFEQQEDEEDGFVNDNFEEDEQSAGSAATYDIGFAHSENEEDDGSIGGFDEVQSGFGSGQDDDERNSGRGDGSPQYSPSSPTSHLASRWGRAPQQSGQRRGQATTNNSSSTGAPWSMSWAVREMPAERSSNRRNRWPDQDMSQYIMLNPDNQPPMGRTKRSTVSGLPTMCSITETQARLARSAALCIKEAASLLKPEVLEPLEPKQRVDMVAQVETVLQPIWNWVLVIMDWTESQLRYGASLNKAGELRYSKSEAKQAKKPVKSHDYLTYALSLLRQGSSEHSDVLPSIDISSLKHIAYVLDSMVNLFKQDLSLCTVEQTEPSTTTNTTAPVNQSRTGPRNTFFRRSESMLFLGANEDESFELSNAESLPLSEQPHLLKPSSTKEELFGRTGKARENQPTGLDMQTTMALGVTHDMAKEGYLTSDAKVGADGLLNRWRKSVELFARVFMDDVGSEDGSILRQLASFSLRQQKFTKQMEYLRQSVKQSELKIEVHRPREKLVPETVKKLNHEYQKLKDMRPQKYKQMDPLGGENPALWGGGGGGGIERGATPTNPRTNTPLMVSRKIKVRFFDEPGEGNGVMRSFFTTIADCLLAPEKLPPMDHTQQNNEPPAPKSNDPATTLRRSGLSGLSRMGRHHRWKDEHHKLDVASEEWTPETAQRESDARYKYKMKIYETAKKDFGANAAKLTGVLSSMSSGQFMNCMNDDEQLKLKILEASKLLKDAHKWKVRQVVIFLMKKIFL